MGNGGDLLPVNNLVYNFTLLCSGFPQVDAGSFDALMSHEIGQKSNIVAPLQEALGETMAERVRIHHNRIDFITSCQLLQLSGDTTGGDPIAVLIQKNESAFLLLLR